MTQNINQFFQLSGLTCPACEKLIEKRVKKIPGVEEVRVWAKDGKTEITADRIISLEEIEKILIGTPYKVILKS